MSLFRKSYLKKLRADLVKEAGGDISDESWNKVIEYSKDQEIKKPEELDIEFPKFEDGPTLEANLRTHGLIVFKATTKEDESHV